MNVSLPVLERIREVLLAAEKKAEPLGEEWFKATWARVDFDVYIMNPAIVESGGIPEKRL